MSARWDDKTHEHTFIKLIIIPMCLAIPSMVVEVLEGNRAVVDTMGTRRIISLDLMQEPVEVGDYVLVHVGFAISKLSREEALESLRLFEEMLEAEEELEDGGAL